MVAVLCCLGAGSEDRAVTLQDLRVAGRVLTFQDSRPSGVFIVAVPYAPTNPASRTEAETIVSLLGDGLPVGNLILRPLMLPQEQLTASARFDAVFATIGLDDSLLRAALVQRHVPCITLHPRQVAQGSCIVAIQSAPSVSIMLSSANATSAGVRFATAFRMMVTEL